MLGMFIRLFSTKHNRPTKTRPVRRTSNCLFFFNFAILIKLIGTVAGAGFSIDGRVFPDGGAVLPLPPESVEEGPRVMLTISRSGKIMDAIFLQSEYSSFDGDGVPGTQEEFKIEVSPAKEECFFQWMKVGTQLHSSFQVLRGADKNLDFTLRGPNGAIIQIEPWTSRATIETNVSSDGVHAVCLGNNMSKFSRKLVHVFFQTQLAEEYFNYTQGILEYETEIQNLLQLIKTVRTRVGIMRSSQSYIRMLFNRDQYNLERLRATVQQRSVVVGAVVVAAAVFQVLFLRRLFQERHLTATDKPRA